MWTRVFSATLKAGALLSIAAAAPAVAQTVPISMSPFAGSSSEEFHRQHFYPFGESEMMARQMATSVRAGPAEARPVLAIWLPGDREPVEEIPHHRVPRAGSGAGRDDALERKSIQPVRRRSWTH